MSHGTQSKQIMKFQLEIIAAHKHNATAES